MGVKSMISRRRFLGGMCAGAILRPGLGSSFQTVALRTHEWFGDQLEEFKFPAEWRVSVQHMKGHLAPVLSASELAHSVRHPVGTKPLREIAAGKTTVAIGFDDLTRPTPTYEIVPRVINELRLAGIRDENILFVTAYGAHYQMNGLEVAKKLGEEAVRQHPWINHNIWENLVDLGTTRAGNQVLINTYYHKADVKITLSGLKAHGTPGYGGGPKMVLPGLAGMKSIRYMHEEIRRAPRPEKGPDGIPIFRVWENEQRQDMIEAARRVGVDFSVQIVYNQDRRPVQVVAGDIVEAHHRAARYAVNHLATEYARNADIVVVNAYPKGAQLHEHFDWGARGLKDGGSIVVINQNPMGEFAWHYLDEERFNHGQSYFAQRAARKRRFPQARQVLLYSQYLQARELDNPYFPPEVVGLRSWDEVLARLTREHRGDIEVAIYPYAGIQHGPARLDLPDEDLPTV
jgi:nickel-dependent lactate racemase